MEVLLHSGWPADLLLLLLLQASAGAGSLPWSPWSDSSPSWPSAGWRRSTAALSASVNSLPPAAGGTLGLSQVQREQNQEVDSFCVYNTECFDLLCFERVPEVAQRPFHTTQLQNKDEDGNDFIVSATCLFAL